MPSSSSGVKESDDGCRLLGTRAPRCRAGLRILTGKVCLGRFFHILILNMRSAMNRFKLLSGGLAASLMVLVTASAIAQEAGPWTMTGRAPPPATVHPPIA